jgi:peptide-methionine (S)-S-oxide reductase
MGMGHLYRNQPDKRTAINSRRGFLTGAACAISTLLWGCKVEVQQNISNQQASTTVTQLPTTHTDVPQGKEIATFAGGCFWCTEAFFTDLKGVEKVVSGYAGGKVASPSYEQVCGGDTGHAEAIQITFDPKVIGYSDLLRIFFTVHDPTTLNRQGADSGTQYRSAVFTHNDAQKLAAEEVVKEVTAKHIWDNPIVTEVTPFTNFYPAETYHQDYYAQNPNQGYCRVVIAPKVTKFREHYRELLKR